MSNRTGLLQRLARLYGIQTAYYDISHRRRPASTEAILAMLRALGAPVKSLEDIPPAWREAQQAQWQRPLEPVNVCWENELLFLKVRLPARAADTFLDWHLKLESGDVREWNTSGAELPVLETAEIEGSGYVLKQLTLPCALPYGYHRLTLELPGRHEETLIISAPMKAYLPDAAAPAWGVFMPLYALQTDKSWGSGDFSALEALMSWVAGMGGQVVATLPLLSTFMDETSDPSPYIPASRLLWNEFYIDIAGVPELERCPRAQALIASPSFQEEINALRRSPLVDYHRGMQLKRRVLEELCQTFFAEPSDRMDELQRFVKANPFVEEYARFRATCEKQRKCWQSWSQPLRGRTLKEDDYNEDNRRHHLFAQWLANQQIGELARKAKESGRQLYLDLPLGVHPDGYDAWREQDAFITDVSAGAPPDAVFTRGQDWIFSPLHPEKIREQGYRYTIAYLRHHLRHAGILRFDHVMGLHRLFCIPHGMEATNGLYIRYHADELYAIMTLESHRHQAVVVGEDLGTVPPYVRPAMKRHNLQGMYVLQYELAAGPQKILRPVPRQMVASLNTHDMPPFASFWQGIDIEDRIKLGFVDKPGAARERKTLASTRRALTAFLREKGYLEESGAVSDVLRACLSLLANSRAQLLLVNLEDLWLETRPHNVPGTRHEYPNWRRKARYSFEEFCQMPQVTGTLRMVDQLRRQGKMK